MRHSGKLVILAILGVALASAAASWWFRYSATHRAAAFWGPEAARLIRDAPAVELYRWSSLPASAFQTGFTTSYLNTAIGSDISHARGLTHLRNALLEVRSYHWPAQRTAPKSWEWVLVFGDAERSRAAVLLFSSDWQYVSSPGRNVLSCEPISSGLAEMLGELAPAEENAR